jgi:peptide/nickel transport system substrate-binding protein
VRQALVYAIDRATISKTLFNGTASVLPVAIPPNAAGYDSTLKALPYDVNMAKQLMAAAGQTSGFTFSIAYANPDSNFPNINNVAQAIGQYWEAIGVKADLNPMESATLVANRVGAKLKGGAMTGGVASSWSELAYIAPIVYVSTSQVRNMSDPKVDALVARLVATLGDDDRAKVATELVDYFYQNIPILPLLGLPAFFGVGPKVKDLKAQAANPYINVWFMQSV